jgi:hypothetical protein
VLDETSDEWNSYDEIPNTTSDDLSDSEKLARIREEIEEYTSELIQHKNLAESITTNAKGVALLAALKSGPAKLQELGAARKSEAVIHVAIYTIIAAAICHIDHFKRYVVA